MKGISLILDNKLVFNKEFYNRKEIRQTNKYIGRLDKRLYKMLVFTIASVGFASNKVYANSEEGLRRTDVVGNEILTILQRVGFWVAVIGCIVEILISVFKKGGGTKEIMAIIFKWLLIFSSFYIVPTLFNFIKDSFV
ncbi:hypothetical protein [Clostridium gasigenes]|uniref:Uncharacterized protein n=1 Tax=Clostridium gasigenes TaxID=94869 RepID=A0A1H0N8D6_9CLOT|nr:hypothetical protein [Clostridium gasigenes]SDO88933.1 hypothetical protein SAMN04488529_101734 [Clostridium gasigenes]